MTEPTKITIKVILIIGLGVAGLGYLGSVYPPYVPVKASNVTVEPQKTQIWRITAYCKGSCCCGKWADGITASGKPAQGKLIAAPKEIPFGTWINVPGYGTAEVLDRGGSIKGRRLDLLFPSHQEALNWGVKYLENSNEISKTKSIR